MKIKHAIIAFTFALVGGLGTIGVFGLNKKADLKEASAATKAVYFLDTENWASVKVYAWRDGGGKNADWPGVAATNTGYTESGHKIYSYSLNTDSYDNFIFNNNNNGKQTADLTPPSNDNSVYDFENSNWANPHTWGFCGTIGGAAWSDDAQTSSTLPRTATSASITITLKMGDTFKFRADGEWDLQLNGANISGQNGDYFTTDASGNAKVKDYKGGTYTFSINWRVENYGDKKYGVSVTNYVSAGETPWKMVGNGSRWSGDFIYSNGLEMAVNPDNVNEVQILSVNLAAGDTFKFYNNTTWYGFSGINSESPMYDAFELQGNQNNIRVKTGYAGTYSFFVNTSTGSIWATSDAYVALDGWAKGFVEAEDLCDGSGEEWSLYAGYYADLDSSAKALFASDKVTAKNDGNYIERAAYRYEQGVAKGQTAFASAQRPVSPSRVMPVSVAIDNTATIIIVISTLSITSLGLFLFIKKRKESK